MTAAAAPLTSTWAPTGYWHALHASHDEHMRVRLSSLIRFSTPDELEHCFESYATAGLEQALAQRDSASPSVAEPSAAMLLKLAEAATETMKNFKPLASRSSHEGVRRLALTLLKHPAYRRAPSQAMSDLLHFLEFVDSAIVEWRSSLASRDATATSRQVLRQQAILVLAQFMATIDLLHDELLKGWAEIERRAELVRAKELAAALRNPSRITQARKAQVGAQPQGISRRLPLRPR